MSDILTLNRGALVRKYRANPRAFPDGIDSKYNRWYRAEDWTNGGEFIGTDLPPVPKPEKPKRGKRLKVVE